MAQQQPSSAPAPFPDPPGAGRGASLPRDPGRATELLYRRHGATVFRFAWHLLGRREDAEDATQATFLAVHGSLTHGTAVLEPRAWVLRIARNECMGRLRSRARQPSLGSLEAVELPAAGGVERSAELRAEIRVARSTLSGLAVEEREAFVLREWLGLETREVALALGLTTGAVDGLAGRARRSLVLAVGGLEAPAGCSGTRSALESGSLDRAVKVHLLRCPTCRGVRRALRPPEETVGRLVPVGVIAERLADAVPGFATGGGGIIAALTAKAAAAPFAAKTAAMLAAALVTAGVAKQEVVDTRHHTPTAASAPVRGGKAHSLRPAGVAARTTPIKAVAPTAADHPAIVAYRAPTASAVPRTTGVRGGVALVDSHRGKGDGTVHARSDTPSTQRGGSDSSGSPTGGSDTGGSHTGGSDTGRSDTGGTHSNGSDTGGAGKDDGTRTVSQPGTSGSKDGSSDDSGGDGGSHATRSGSITSSSGGTSSGGGHDSGGGGSSSAGGSDGGGSSSDRGSATSTGSGSGSSGSDGGVSSTTSSAVIPVTTTTTATTTTATTTTGSPAAATSG